MTMAFTGAHVAAHAAAEKQRQEEEEMTRYSQEELENDWEFKIVRSASGAFKNPEVLQALIEEEALAGWKMVEKFDNHRVRFKRQGSASRRDAMLPPDIDPYRTQYGISPEGLAFSILGVALGVGGLVALLVFLFNSM